MCWNRSDPFLMRFPLRSLNMKYCTCRLCAQMLGSCHWPVLPRGWWRCHRGGIHQRLSAGYHCHLVHWWPELWPGEKLQRCFGVNIGLALLSPLLIGRAPLPALVFSSTSLLSLWGRVAELRSDCCLLYLFFLFFLSLKVSQSKFHRAGLEEVKSSLLSVLIKTPFRLMIFSKDLIYHLQFFGLLLRTADCIHKIWKSEKK